jgi:hypothetical protein
MTHGLMCFPIGLMRFSCRIPTSLRLHQRTRRELRWNPGANNTNPRRSTRACGYRRSKWRAKLTLQQPPIDGSGAVSIEAKKLRPLPLAKLIALAVLRQRIGSFIPGRVTRFFNQKSFLFRPESKRSPCGIRCPFPFFQLEVFLILYRIRKR